MKRRTQPSRRLIAGLSLALCASACRSERDPALDALPNVLLITLDTLRADHLDLYGYEKQTAPFLRALGDEGAVFTSASSTSSWTAPSTASLFTGRHPVHHGVTMGIHAQRRIAEQVAREGGASIELNRIPDELEVLPQLFRDAGYTTFAASSNLNVSDRLGFDRGFEKMKMRNMESAGELVDRLEHWGDEIRGGEPWLLYLHLNDVHAPYDEVSPWFEASGDERADVVAAYDSEIRQLDEVLAATVARHASARPTLIVVVSDHGEAFWERGSLGHHPSLHREVNRIVFLVHGPRLGVRAARYDDNVSLVDVLPTLAALAGIEGPAESDGVSLAPILRGDADADALRAELARRVVFAHRVDEYRPGREIWSALRGRFKLIDDGDGPSLYDVASDPFERRDLGEEEPSRTRDLSREIRALRAAATGPGGSRVDVEIDPGQLEALRELGYVEESEE